MSVTRPAQGLLGRCVASTRSITAAPCRSFHSSAPRSKRRARFRNVLAEDLGLITPEQRKQYRQDKFPDYTEKELKDLEQKFTPQQWEALQAGEKAVDAEDLMAQGRLRSDPYRPNYIDDMSVMDPRYDVKLRDKVTPVDPTKVPTTIQWAHSLTQEMAATASQKASDQLARAMVRALRKVKASKGGDLIEMTDEELDAIEKDPTLVQKYIDQPDEPEPEANATGPEFITQVQAEKLDEAIDEAWAEELRKIGEGERDDELSETWFEQIQHGPDAEGHKDSAFLPELPKIPGVAGRPRLARRDTNQPASREDPGDWEHLLNITRLPFEKLESLYAYSGITQRRIANQTRLGKIISFSYQTIVSNGDGMIGLGMAKAPEGDNILAMRQARTRAILNMKPIRRYENRTIYGTVIGKFGATTVELSSRPPGWGIRAPGKVFEIMRAVGIHDVSARILRNGSPMNLVKATIEALHNQPDPEAIALGRGKKLVDVRKVYYGGAVL